MIEWILLILGIFFLAALSVGDEENERERVTKKMSSKDFYRWPFNG